MTVDPSQLAALAQSMAWLQGQSYPNVAWPQKYRAALRPPDLTMLGQLAQAQAQMTTQALAPAALPAPTAPMMAPQLQQAPWVREQVYYPTPYFPQHPNIGRQVRDYIRNFALPVAGTAGVQTVQIDIPGVIYALTGSARRTDSGAFPVGWDRRDAFDVQFVYNNGEQLITLAGQGSTIVGSAERPRLLGGPAWTFDRGAQITVTVTPVIANLQVTINCWVMEIRGPTNISSLG